MDAIDQTCLIGELGERLTLTSKRSVLSIGGMYAC